MTYSVTDLADRMLEQIREATADMPEFDSSVLASTRQPIPVIAAGVIQPPLKPVKPIIPLAYAGPVETVAIDSAFAKTRETVAALEAKRLEPMTSVDWSPAQHVRAAS